MTLRRHSGRDTTHINLPSGTVSLETVLLPGGMVTATDTTWTPYAWVQDRLGNVRGVVDMAAGSVVERSDYYAFGSRIASDPSAPGAYPSIQANRWRYAGKEEQADVTGLSLDDFGARMYDPFIARWMTVDPLSEKYPGLSPYAYCAGDPVNLVDYNGEDWFFYSLDGQSNPTWNWHEGNQYNTGVKDTEGNEIILSGVEVVVVFNGSREEKLGEKGMLNGEGARSAEVIVYGAGGSEDISTYTGFTMTSDAEKYTPIAEGIYNLNYDQKGKSGTIPSHWVLEHRGRIPTMDGIPNNNPKADATTKGMPYKSGIFIHRTNNDGYAGGSVSTGCLLILFSDWDSFEKNLIGHTRIKVQINRSVK